jgi:choline dehydrogenase-like flavoprotein
MGLHAIHDAIVVGSGAAGSWAAKELTEGGLDVVLLEAGRDLDARRDFPFCAPRRAGRAFRLWARMQGQHIQARCAFFAPHTRHFYVNDRKDAYTTPAGKPFVWFRGRQLGGRLHTWARHAPRTASAGFVPSDDASDERRWPISYEELAPYYAKVERTLGVFGRSDQIPELPDGEFLDSAPFTPFEEEFCRRVTAGAPAVHITPARNVKHNPGRIPIPLAFASRTGRLRIETDSSVKHILIDASTGRATGVQVVDRNDKQTREVLGGVIVLAASAFESVRILLNSACPRHPAGIGGSSGALGHFVGDHLFHWAAASVSSNGEPAVPSIPEPADAYDWAPTRLYIPDFWQRKAPHDRFGRYGVQISFAHPAGTSIASMSFQGEMMPRFENRLTIDRSKADAWGIPVVHIDCTHSDVDESLLQEMREAGRELAFLAGMEPIDPGKRHWLENLALSISKRKSVGVPPGTAIHETGGARMGSDRRRSVLNKYNQCWDCENVFVTDGACFPYAPFTSPTLTIMALAVRTCGYILREQSRLNPRRAG